MGWTDLMRERARPRTLTFYVLRALVPRAVAFGVGAAAVVLGQALALDPSAHSSSEAVRDVSVPPPAWTTVDQARFADCVPASAWPAGRPAAFVVVHSFRDDADRKMPFDAAWAANHNGTEVDDVWVLGVCGPLS